MEILEYLPEIIIGLLIVIGAVTYLIKFMKSSPAEKKEMIGTILYALALKAEKEYGSKTGQAKKAQVIAWFYEKYPALTYVLSKEQLGEYLDEIVAEMNEWLKSNPIAQLNILGEVTTPLQVINPPHMQTDGTVISDSITTTNAKTDDYIIVDGTETNK